MNFKTLSKQDKNLLKCSFLGTIPEFMLLPIYALYVEKLGGNILDVGWAFILFSIAKGIFTLLFGSTSMFKNNLHFWLMIGFFLSALCDCTYIFINNQYEFFFIQVISGITLGLINPSWESIYSEAQSLQESGGKWSIWNGGYDLSIGFAAILGTLLVRLTSWDVMFVIMMLISLWSTYYSYLVYMDRPRHNKELNQPESQNGTASNIHPKWMSDIKSITP